MSVVPGSPKVTRCTSKPAPLRIFSSTPSAPASAGVTDGQRTRSRAMERASVMPPLNMRHWRWASSMGNKFQLGLLRPARPRIDWREGIRPEPIGPSRPSQAEQLDKAPEAKNECDAPKHADRIGIGKPILEVAVQTRSNVEWDHPPTALITIVKPLDPGGRKEPDADDHDRSSSHVEQQGERGRRRRIAEAGAQRERRRIVEDIEDVDADVN